MTDIAIRVENLSKQYRIGGPQARYKMEVTSSGTRRADRGAGVLDREAGFPSPYSLEKTLDELIVNV